MNIFDNSVARVSQWLLGGAAAALIAVAMPAYSQSGTAKQANGTSICSFTTFSFDATTNTLTLACTGIVDPPPPPPPTCTNPAAGSISFWQSNSSANSGAATNVLITRSYAMNCQYTLNWSVSAPSGVTVTVNGSSALSGQVTFQNQDFAVKTLAVVGTGSGSGNITMNLSYSSGGYSPTPANLVSPFSTHTIAFTGTGVTPPGGISRAGCPTSADVGGDPASITRSAEKSVLTLMPGKVGAVAFTPTVGGLMYLSTTETVNTPSDADHEVTFSPCPGDFGASVPDNCRYKANYVGSTRYGNIAPFAPYQCVFQSGKEYFMNVRHVKITDSTLNSCNGPGYLNGACEVRVQITGGMPGQ